VYSIKVGYVQNDKDPLTQGLFYLADILKKDTNGRIEVKVFASGVLGDTPDVLQQAQSGMDIGLLVDAGRFADYVPELMIFDAPYLFKNFDEANTFAQSDMFKGWTDKVIPLGARICSWNWYQGPRQFWTQNEIKGISDLKNQKIRTGSSPMWQATIEALGAKPVALPWGETYTSIQQKVCDGTESQVPGAYGIKLNEVTKYMTRTNHFQLLTGMAVSEAWYQKLPDDLKKIFMEDCVKAGAYASQITLDNISRMESEMTAKGLTIKDIDMEPFIQATEKVYAKFEGFPELRKQIRAIVEK
jgi:TRAP-type C4-dicarboxylate transport system substrate-binding protein